MLIFVLVLKVRINKIVRCIRFVSQESSKRYDVQGLNNNFFFLVIDFYFCFLHTGFKMFKMQRVLRERTMGYAVLKMR